MAPKWLDIVGLLIALAGAITLACGLLISKKQAFKIGVSRLAEDSDDKNICLPHVRDKIKEARFALIGIVLLVVGFILQLIGNWPRS